MKIFYINWFKTILVRIHFSWKLYVLPKVSHRCWLQVIMKVGVSFGWEWMKRWRPDRRRTWRPVVVCVCVCESGGSRLRDPMRRARWWWRVGAVYSRPCAHALRPVSTHGLIYGAVPTALSTQRTWIIIMLHHFYIRVGGGKGSPPKRYERQVGTSPEITPASSIARRTARSFLIHAISLTI